MGEERAGERTRCHCGGTLRTIREGCEYRAAISKEREQQRHWQQVRELTG